MPIQLEEYRAELINKLLFAVSKEEVESIINEAMIAVKQKQPESDTVFQFIEKTIADLKLFDPIKKQAQQWNNIKVARILLNRIRQNVQT